MDVEFQKIYMKYSQDKDKLTPVVQQYEEDRIQKKQQAIQQRQQEIQQQYQEIKIQLEEKSLNLLKKAVEIVAKFKKFNFVLADSQTLFSDLSTDLTSEVMVELLKLDAAETAPKK
jgi:Skp family chaperone for outer membrane proteins